MPFQDWGAVPRGSETVLLVDSEPETRKLASFMLAKQGYAVLEARTATDALRSYAEQGKGIDLLMTEVLMPRMDGYQLAARLAEAQPGLRVLFMEDAVYCRAVRREAAQKGHVFLEKPFTMRDLAGRVRQVLDKPLARALGVAL